MLTLTDDQARELGKRIAEATMLPDELEQLDDLNLEMIGRISLREAMPYVLLELREPTDAMLDAGNDALDPLSSESPYAVWQSMIDNLIETRGRE